MYPCVCMSGIYPTSLLRFHFAWRFKLIFTQCFCSINLKFHNFWYCFMPQGTSGWAEYFGCCQPGERTSHHRFWESLWLAGCATAGLWPRQHFYATRRVWLRNKYLTVVEHAFASICFPSLFYHHCSLHAHPSSWIISFFIIWIGLHLIAAVRKLYSTPNTHFHA